MTVYEVKYRFHCLATPDDEWRDSNACILGGEDAEAAAIFLKQQVLSTQVEIDGVTYPVDGYRLVSVAPLCSIDGVLPGLQSMVVNAIDGDRT